MKAQLPMIKVKIQDKELRALVDSGCSKSVISEKLDFLHRRVNSDDKIVMMNGDVVNCFGSQLVTMSVEGTEIMLDCLVSKVLPDCDMLLGMDGISMLGGAFIDMSGVRFNGRSGTSGRVVAAAAPVLTIEDKDFRAEFEGGQWIVSWKWCESEPMLRNTVAQYNVAPQAKEAFEAEVDDWIEHGWLQEYSDGDPPSGIIPLMAIIQPNKQKIRPVLDFRELNSFVSSHTAQSDVCHEKLRSWRRMGDNVSIIDLRKAYLQICVTQELWKHQVVKYKKKHYCLTRLGFGLNVAPKIMTQILKKVLSLDSEVERGTDNYIDDIIVNESIVSSERVQEHLSQYGLVAKPTEKIDGGRVLGLRVERKDNTLCWKRDNTIGLEPIQTKRDVFALCGRLVGHFPVGGWLRPACGVLKRMVNDLSWDEQIDDRMKNCIDELMSRVMTDDPVRGKWNVSDRRDGKVWCDASSLAIGVVLEIDGNTVEDACWLRKANDSDHINLAELEAVVKGVNMALKWELTILEILTDSKTVEKWLQSVIDEDRRISTHGLGEMLVRRRLGLLRNLMNEYDITMSVNFVRSEANIADKLTRAPKVWMQSIKCGSGLTIGCTASLEVNNSNSRTIQDIHELNHFGVDRTLYFARLKEPKVKRKEVEDVVRRCNRCRQIDPAPVIWESGTIEVSTDWTRLSVDVTHVKETKRFQSCPFLTVVDCGPSRYAVWRRIKDESSSSVIDQLESIFSERGPPDEIVWDNYATFRSTDVSQLLEKWGVCAHFRCAFRPSGNGVVERNHRTIKRMVARTGGSVQEMLFYYNNSPRCHSGGNIIPSARLFKYKINVPQITGNKMSKLRDTVKNPYQIGDQVYVKPSRSNCTQTWRRGEVTDVTSNVSLEIDGIPRHVRDVRAVIDTSESSDDCGGTTEDEAAEENSEIHELSSTDERSPARVRPHRHVRMFPRWLSDFEVG